MKKPANKEIPKTGTSIDGTKPLIGLVYSTETNLKTIRANEVRHHGSAADRINEAEDYRIKNRIYLKLKKGDKLPTKGVGDGDHAYIAEINGIFDLRHASEEQLQAIQDEIDADEKETNGDNKFESAILSKGYTGYLSGDIIVVLDTNVKVKKFEQDLDENEPLEAPETDIKESRKELPKSTTKRKLTKKEASSLSDVLPALKAKAPSTSIKGGVLSVNDDEYQAFLKEAITFPNMPKFISEADIDTSEETDQDNQASFKTRKLSRQKRKKVADKRLADTIKKILLDDEFTKMFSGKVSDTFKNFESASKAYKESLESEKKPAEPLSHVDDEIDDADNFEQTNSLLEDIRDILTTIADETIAENSIAKEDAKERLQDVLEQTKNNTDEQSQYLANTLNQVLAEIRTNEIEDDLGIRNKEPFPKKPTTDKTITETMTSPEDIGIVSPKEPTTPELKPTVEPKEPTKVESTTSVEPSAKLDDKAVEEAINIISRQKSNGNAPPVPNEVETVAEKLGIVPEKNWQDTLNKIEEVVNKETNNSEVSPKEPTKVELTPTVEPKEPTTPELKPTVEPKESGKLDASNVEPKEPTTPELKPTVEPKEPTKVELTPTVEPKKPAYQTENEDWDTPLRLTPEQIEERKKKQESGKLDASNVEPKEPTTPELTPVQKEMEHSKEVGETVPKVKGKTELPVKPRNTPRTTYRKESTIKDSTSGNTVFKPSFTPTPQNLSKSDVMLGSFFNRNKDIVTKDESGEEISRRPSANKIEYTKKLIRMGDEYLGKGATSSVLRLFKKKKTAKPTDDKPSPTAKVSDKPDITPSEPKAEKGSMLTMGKRKFIRVADNALGRGTGRSILETLPKQTIKKQTLEVSKFDKTKQEKDTKKRIVPEAAEPTSNQLTPPVAAEPEDKSSLLSNLADLVPTGGKGLLGKAGSMLGKVGKFAGKIAAPLAAGASVVGGISDIAEGGKIESASDIIPKGGLLDKINPFNYVMNAGRFVGDKWNKGYSAVSSAVGGSGELGSDIYNMVNGKPLDPNDPNAPHAPAKPVDIQPKPIEQKDLSVRPKLQPHELKPETEQLADAGLEKAAASEQQAISSSPTNIVSNVTNNSSPTQQIMPNNMMHQRNNENAYQAMNNRKFSL